MGKCEMRFEAELDSAREIGAGFEIPPEVGVLKS